jgi:hypothetical protein
LTCEYLSEFSKKFETVLLGYSGAGGKLIHEKKPEAKNLVTLSLPYAEAIVPDLGGFGTHPDPLDCGSGSCSFLQWLEDANKK